MTTLKLSRNFLHHKSKPLQSFQNRRTEKKRLIKSSRQISDLNFFSSLSSKAKICTSVNAFIEGGRLISHMPIVSDKLNIGGYLVTVDMERTSESLDHGFR